MNSQLGSCLLFSSPKKKGARAHWDPSASLHSRRSAIGISRSCASPRAGSLFVLRSTILCSFAIIISTHCQAIIADCYCLHNIHRGNNTHTALSNTNNFNLPIKFVLLYSHLFTCLQQVISCFNIVSSSTR